MTLNREGSGSTAERYSHSGRYLHYDGIKLVPVATDWYPYNRPEYADEWYIPGRRMMSTDALVTLATKRGVAVTMTEYEGVAVTTTWLN